MKNSIKTLICAFALSTVFAFNASADDKESKKATGFGTGIYTTKQGKISINVDKYNEKPTVILLQDQKGNVLYKEVISKNETKLRRSLDMSEMPAGEYELKIVSNGEKQTKKLELQEAKPERLISMN